MLEDDSSRESGDLEGLLLWCFVVVDFEVAGAEEVWVVRDAVDEMEAESDLGFLKVI